MSAYRKNVLVGATVLVALLMLGWMLLKFGGGAARVFVPPQIKVLFVAGRADGLGEGSAVQFRGVTVGRVTQIRRAEDNNSVLIDALIDRDPPLPGNLIGFIRAQSLLGSGTAIALEHEDETTGRPSTRPVTSVDQMTPLHDGQKILAKYVGVDILPPAFADLADELKLTSRQFRESNIVGHADQAVLEARDMIKSFRAIVDDPKVRDNLQQSLANIRTATDKANAVIANFEKFSAELQNTQADVRQVIAKANTAVDKVGTTIDKTTGHIDDLSKQVNDRLTQIAKLLDTFQSVAAKVDTGNGTAGKLVNDPRLYENLVDTSRELNATITDLKRLVNQWEQEGIYFKLSK